MARWVCESGVCARTSPSKSAPPTVSGWKRSLRTGTARRRTSGGRRSSWRPRTSRHDRDHTPERQVEAERLALAGAVHDGRRGRLERHPRFVFHFTPTSCSWLNAIEGFSPSSPGAVSNAASSARSSSSPPSTASSKRPIMTPSPSSGPPTRIRSSPPSNAGTKRRSDPLVAFLAEHFRSGFVDPREVELVTGSKVLGLIPAVPPPERLTGLPQKQQRWAARHSASAITTSGKQF
jgi:hypothetical protein